MKLLELTLELANIWKELRNNNDDKWRFTSCHLIFYMDMKSILVTGGSGGIGEAICREFATLGFTVGVHYFKNEERAKNLASEIGGIPVRFDVRDYASVKKGIESFVKKVGGLDVLVNNAGIAQKIQPLLDTSEEEFDDVFSTNVKGVFNCTKNALPFMLEKGGNIVNIASMWGLVGASCESVYSASKSAIIGFTKSLAKEYASANIRVNAIASGYIDTKMNNALSEEDKKLVIEDILLNRAGKPEEVASAVRFICESAKFMTGEVLNLSGGQVIV